MEIPEVTEDDARMFGSSAEIFGKTGPVEGIGGRPAIPGYWIPPGKRKLYPLKRHAMHSHMCLKERKNFVIHPILLQCVRNM